MRYHNTSQREYRVISGGEDGMVFFWSFMADYNGHDLSKVDVADHRNPASLLVKVNPSHVAPIRSIHEIHLTVEAQLYTIVIG